MNNNGMNEATMIDAATGIYDDAKARPDMYGGADFNPLHYLRENVDEEGNRSLSLDIKYRKHWFRLVYPGGKIVSRFSMTEQGVIFEARVYADKADPEDSFLAVGHASRDRGGPDAKAYEKYFVDWAETMAVGRALTNAGFDVPWVNIPALEVMDPTTGAIPDGAPANPAAPTDPAMRRQGYSSVTAPPVEHEAASGPQTPAGQVAAGQPAPALAPAAQPPQPQANAGQVLDWGRFPATVDDAMSQLNVEIAKTIVVNFGKNKGKTLGEVAMSNPGDLNWYVDTYGGKNTWVKAGAALLIQTALANAS